MKRSRLFPTLVLLLLALVVGTVLLRPDLREQKPQHRPPAPARVSNPPQLPAPEAPASSVPTPRPETPTSPAPAEAPRTSKPEGLRTVEVRGRVVDVNGTLQPFLKVEAFMTDGRKNERHLDAETDDKGTFKLDCPEWTRITFTAHLPGHGRGFYNLSTTDPEHPFGAVNDITLALRAATSFDGQLMRPDGSPAAGARLRFHPVSTRYLTTNDVLTAMNLLHGTYPPDEAWDQRCREALFLTDWTVTTDAQGQFQAQSLAAGVNYTVEVERSGRESARIEMHVKGRKDRLTLQLPP